MTSETDFHRQADATLLALYDALDPQYEAGTVQDLELQGGILTIRTDRERTFVVSKHAPSRQIWLASPLSGGLHFRLVDAGNWQLADGRELISLVMKELAV